MRDKVIQMDYGWKYASCCPFNWMVADLWRGVQAEQNYLVALGLFSYSEAIGRMILGTTGKGGGGATPFREFTEKYVGYSFADWDAVFGSFRNGLAHEFYIKRYGSAVYNDDGSAPCGIDVSGGSFVIRIHSYFRHFVGGLERALAAGVLH